MPREQNDNQNIHHVHVPWLIIGGGIHGTHIAVRLLANSSNQIGNHNIVYQEKAKAKAKEVENEDEESEDPPPPRLCIIDENKELLYRWKSRAAATGMDYLRSSAGYHLDVDEHSLRHQFGKRKNIAALNTNSGNSANNKNNNNNNSSRRKKNKSRRKRKQQQQQQQQQHQRQNNNGNNLTHRQLNIDLEGGKKKSFFANDYERPRLDVFNRHCDSVIAKYNLNKVHVQGKVTNIQPFDDHVRVEVSLVQNNSDRDDDGTYKDKDKDKDMTNNRIVYTADQVVLALGNDEPRYAEWVEQEDIDSGLVQHLLDVDRNKESFSQSLLESFDCDDEKKSNEPYSVAVVGGGISAAHKVLALVKEAKEKYPQRHTAIHLISRHEMREQQFDTHQDWMMDRAAAKRSKEGGGSGVPKRQRMFSKTLSWKERRLIIAKERVPGTVTKDVNRGENGLMYAIDNGDVHWHRADVVSRSTSKDESSSKVQSLKLLLSSGETIDVDQILLATGFEKGIPGGELIKRDLIEKSGLKVSDYCGFPIVDSDLKWHPRISVSGALAELAIGPSARNIAGARLAAERIIHA